MILKKIRTGISLMIVGMVVVMGYHYHQLRLNNHTLITDNRDLNRQLDQQMALTQTQSQRLAHLVTLRNAQTEQLRQRATREHQERQQLNDAIVNITAQMQAEPCYHLPYPKRILERLHQVY